MMGGIASSDFETTWIFRRETEEDRKSKTIHYHATHFCSMNKWLTVFDGDQKKRNGRSEWTWEMKRTNDRNIEKTTQNKMGQREFLLIWIIHVIFHLVFSIRRWCRKATEWFSNLRLMHYYEWCDRIANDRIYSLLLARSWELITFFFRSSFSFVWI